MASAGFKLPALCGKYRVGWRGLETGWGFKGPTAGRTTYRGHHTILTVQHGWSVNLSTNITCSSQLLAWEGMHALKAPSLSRAPDAAGYSKQLSMGPQTLAT